MLITPPSAEERERALAAVPPPRPPARPPLTPGRCYYLLRHELPRWLVPRSERWRRWARLRQMRRAERRLSFSTLAAPDGAPVEIALLTGRDYVPQTLYAMKSWLRHAGRPVRFTLVDDGTLDPGTCARLRRAGSAITIRDAGRTENLLDTLLPAARHPVLRRLRLGYVHLRKLTDTLLDAAGARIVADTDVLLHRPPTELLGHYDAGRPFFFHDCAESYGLPSSSLGEIAGVEIPPRVNSGCFCFDPARLDWDYLETVSTRILARHGYSFYHEQALVAVLCGLFSAVRLGDDYQVFPDETEARSPTRVALHYLDGANNPRMLLSWPLLEK
jgi:hypothetical protein